MPILNKCASISVATQTLEITAGTINSVFVPLAPQNWVLGFDITALAPIPANSTVDLVVNGLSVTYTLNTPAAPTNMSAANQSMTFNAPMPQGTTFTVSGVLSGYPGTGTATAVFMLNGTPISNTFTINY